MWEGWIAGRAWNGQANEKVNIFVGREETQGDRQAGKGLPGVRTHIVSNPTATQPADVHSKKERGLDRPARVQLVAVFLSLGHPVMGPYPIRPADSDLPTHPRDPVVKFIVGFSAVASGYAGQAAADRSVTAWGSLGVPLGVPAGSWTGLGRNSAGLSAAVTSPLPTPPHSSSG